MNPYQRGKKRDSKVLKSKNLNCKVAAFLLLEIKEFNIHS